MREFTQEQERNSDAIQGHGGMVRPGHDLRQLGRDIDSLWAMQRELATSGHLEKLIKIIQRDGWTTPTEFFLVSSQIQHMADVVQGLEKAQAALLRGANMVGQR